MALRHTLRLLLPLLLVSFVHSIPWAIHQQPGRGICPDTNLQCRVNQTCCPNRCCPPNTPLCHPPSGRCVNENGETRCPSASGKVELGTLCKSSTNNCCVRPFNYCSKSTPVLCVDQQGYARCLDPTTNISSPGVLCTDGTCCPNPKKCCERKQAGRFFCCDSGGIGGPLELDDRVEGTIGNTPVPISSSPTPTPGSMESPTAPASIVPSIVPPANPTQGPNGADPSESLEMITPSEPIPSESPTASDEQVTISPGPTTEQTAGSEDDGDPSESPEDDDSVCLPASAKVEVMGKGVTRVDQVNTGDMLRVGSDEFSRVFMWTHKNGAYAGKRYVTVLAEKDTQLKVTEGHVIYKCTDMRVGCEKKATVAEDVQIGDGIWRVSGGVEEIVKVLKVRKGEWGKGLYNPQTEHGDIVVDGVVASCYTKYVPIGAAHALLAPLRAFFGVGLSVMEDI